jgi:hypothetical protein
MGDAGRALRSLTYRNKFVSHFSISHETKRVFLGLTPETILDAELERHGV